MKSNTTGQRPPPSSPNESPCHDLFLANLKLSEPCIQIICNASFNATANWNTCSYSRTDQKVREMILSLIQFNSQLWTRFSIIVDDNRLFFFITKTYEPMQPSVLHSLDLTDSTLFPVFEVTTKTMIQAVGGLYIEPVTCTLFYKTTWYFPCIAERTKLARARPNGVEAQRVNIMVIHFNLNGRIFGS